MKHVPAPALLALVIGLAGCQAAEDATGLPGASDVAEEIETPCPDGCDDGDECTEDACDPLVGCVHPPLQCDDDNVCNGAESCDPASGCISGEAIDCQDGLPCNGTEACDANEGCLPGQPTAGCCEVTGDCDDGDPCNGQGLCDTATGTCVIADGPHCDDGNPCNGNEVCEAFVGCVPGLFAGCDDGNFCNGLESCDGEGGCQPGLPLVCNDGLLCNGQEACDAEKGCVAGPPEPGCCKGQGDCEDGNICNGLGSCDTATDTCAVEPPVPCDDGNPCNGFEACTLEGGCAAVAGLECDDGNVCNGIETCDSELGCVAGDDSGCDDGNLCNGYEGCDSKDGCQPGVELLCDDNNPCNGAEECVPESGCEAGGIPSCDDGLLCNGAETCNPNVGSDPEEYCSPGTSLECSDGDKCNGTETCSDSGGCQDGTEPDCDDGNACTTDACDALLGCTHEALNCVSVDFCSIASCHPINGCTTSPLTCTDGNPCTADACDPEAGCVFTPEACDDEDDCTVDACVPNFIDDLGTCLHVDLTCEDGDFCTADWCVGGEQPCVHEDLDCDDGDICTGSESCDPATGCLGGEPLDCDDDDACSADDCQAGAGCTHVFIDCDDGDPCTTEACSGGICKGGPKDCSDGDPCTTDSCDGGTCSSAPQDCDDGDPCTTESCKAGVCVALPIPCNDGDPCTVDACEEGECVAPPLDCDDEEPCTEDTCSFGVCGHGPLDCDDEDACTIDGCSAGECTHDAAVCEDGDLCTVDACDSGVGCTFGPLDCSDELPCTVDSCSDGGCENTPLDCSDGDACTLDLCTEGVCSTDLIDCNDEDACTVDACVGGECGYEALECDDGDACTGEDCDPASGCTNTPITCDDEDPCTVDACDEDLGCTASPVDCSDGLDCTEDVCAGGDCSNPPIDCSDGDSCTVDSCVEGELCSHSINTCDDGVKCTTDGCDPATGCTFEPLECDDGDPCTGTETCVELTGTCAQGVPVGCLDENACNGQESCDPETGDCVPGSPLDCDDSDLCTTDGCDTQSGCASVPIDCDDDDECTDDACAPFSGLCESTPRPCDDGDDCTIETCSPATGICASAALDCDDADPCTTDTCLPGTGCDSTPVACDDGDDCTIDTCSGGICSSVGKDCSDADDCTVDTCEAGLCDSVALDCDDDDACTDDACQGGVCKSSTTDCSDGDPCTLESCDSQSGCFSGVDLCGEGSFEWDFDTPDQWTTSGKAELTSGAAQLARGELDVIDAGDPSLLGHWKMESQAITGVDAGDASLVRLYRMDESAWTPGSPTVADETGAAPGTPSAIGTAIAGSAGPVDGAGLLEGRASIEAGAPTEISSALTVMGWVKLTNPKRPGRKPIAEAWPSSEEVGFDPSNATQVISGSSADPGYTGAVFDGSFMHFIPANRSTDADDNELALFTGSSWTRPFLTGDGFRGGSFDGKYIYVVPFASGEDSGYHGTVNRYPKQEASFSEETFDLTTIDAGLVGFSGAVYADGFVYLVPTEDSNGPHSRVVRYDTSKAFTAASSWEVADLSTMHNCGGGEQIGYFGGGYDGRYVYLAPHVSSGSTCDSLITRFDTESGFGFSSSGSWSFKITGGSPHFAAGFAGASFDGSAMIFAPFLEGGSEHSLALRYDTTLPFLDDGSYQTFTLESALSTGSVGFSGSFWDGRDLWMLPGGPDLGSGDAWLAKHEGEGLFTTAGKWLGDNFLFAFGPPQAGYRGGVFDGRYLWAVAHRDTQTGFHKTMIKYDTAEGGASWSLLAGFPAQDGMLGGGPIGPAAMVETDTGHHVVAASEPLDDQWHHLAMVYEAGELRLYVDAEVVGTKSFTSGPIKAPSTSLWMGGDDFEGELDEVAIFDAALTDAQILARVHPQVPESAGNGLPLTAQSVSLDTSASAALGSAAGFSDPGALMSVASEGDLHSDPYAAEAWIEVPAPAPAHANLGLSTLGREVPLQTLGDTHLESFDPAVSDKNSWMGGAYDGTYVYFAPHLNRDPEGQDLPHGDVVRFEPGCDGNDFVNAGCWDAFDLTTLEADLTGYVGAVYDGAFVYFVPEENQDGNHGHVVRLDPSAPFTSASAWQVYDVNGTGGHVARGYRGGVFDGRYLYLIPHLRDGSPHGVFVRYDTQAAGGFTDSASWSAFDAALVGELSGQGIGTTGYSGGMSDGRYLYFSPLGQGTPQSNHANVLRYDSQAAFTSAGSWAAFDASDLGSPTIGGLSGGTFDGRYVYFMPREEEGLIRYDSEGSFTDKASWDAVDIEDVLDGDGATLSAEGAAFDGRYVWIVGGEPAEGSLYFARYDPLKAFDAASSYQIYLGIEAFGTGGGGLVLTGTHIYLPLDAGEFIFGQPATIEHTFFRLPLGSDGGWEIATRSPAQDGGFSGGPAGLRGVQAMADGTTRQVLGDELEPGWHHLTLEFDTTNGLSLTVDASLVGGDGAEGATANAHSAELLVGGVGFSGRLDEAAIWDALLPSGEHSKRMGLFPFSKETVDTVITASPEVGTVAKWTSLSFGGNAKALADTRFQLSIDGGFGWLHHDGAAWVSTTDLADGMTLAEVNSNLDSLQASINGLAVRIILTTGDATLTPKVTSLSVTFDTEP